MKAKIIPNVKQIDSYLRLELSSMIGFCKIAKYEIGVTGTIYTTKLI